VGALPWHIVEADGVGVDGVPTVGVTVSAAATEVTVVQVYPERPEITTS
jgi:hypothetical protein